MSRCDCSIYGETRRASQVYALRHHRDAPVAQGERRRVLQRVWVRTVALVARLTTPRLRLNRHSSHIMNRYCSLRPAALASLDPCSCPRKKNCGLQLLTQILFATPLAARPRRPGIAAQFTRCHFVIGQRSLQLCVRLTRGYPPCKLQVELRRPCPCGPHRLAFCTWQSERVKASPLQL